MNRSKVILRRRWWESSVVASVVCGNMAKHIVYLDLLTERHYPKSTYTYAEEVVLGLLKESAQSCQYTPCRDG